MSKLTKYTPSIPLGEFVEYLYVDQAAGSVPSLNEYAQPTHPLIVVSPETSTHAGTSKVKGIYTKEADQVLQGPTPVLGIRLKPYGLYTGFGIKGESVVNRVVSASVLMKECDLLQAAEIFRDDDHQQAIEYVHTLLFNMLEPKPLLYEITEMIDRLVASDLARNSQRELAAAFERSPKSFIEVFRKAVGIPPLNYLHIYKIEAAKRMICNDPSISLTDVGYSLGFYDQSHFIRVFKAQTGHTPLQFKDQPKTKLV